MKDLADMSLDELFIQAKNSHNGQKKHKGTLKAEARKAAEAAQTEEDRIAAQLYKNENNWVRMRGLALIEEGTETLLGNFSEYIHKTVPGARKLVKELFPISVEGVEHVKGWVPGEAKRWVAPATPPREVTIHLHLECLELAGRRTKVKAFRDYSTIIRVELAEDVNFSVAGEELLTLPAGTDVFELMSPQSVKGLELELGK